MSYIEKSLTTGEKIYKTFPHHWITKFFIAVHFLFGLLTSGVWLIPAVLVWLHWKCIEQGVTNKRVIRKSGIISRKTSEMRLSAIESIVIEQSLLGRALGYGTVTVTGRGSGNVTIKWMADPMRVKRRIESAEQANEKQAAAQPA